jgi:hypothetical protein
LALGAAAVLRRAVPEPIAQYLEEGGAVVRNLDGSAVDCEGERSAPQLND